MTVSDIVPLLARHPMFGALDRSALEALAAQLRWFCLPGGRSLFKTGEPADALYLLKSGSLGIFASGDEASLSEPLQLVGVGESVGEISLLGGHARTRSVRALRDSELLRLDRATFERLVARHPQAMLEITRLALARLLQRERRHESPGTPRTFALLPVDTTVPVRALAMQLARELEAFAPCLVIDAELGAGRDSDWFAAREARGHFLIYLDAGGDPAWRRRCLRQADVLLLPALAAQPARSWPGSASRHPEPARYRTRHLLLLHPGHGVDLGAARRWRRCFEGELRHHHICGSADIVRLARLISGHGRGLVLAGGGARGLAHLGAMRALHEAGHVFDAVGGTSIGAILGAGLAAGWSLDEIAERCVHAFVSGRPLSDWSLPLVALTRGRRASRMLRRTFGALAIEDLRLPFFCVSTSLSGDGMVAHRHGPLWLWLRASSAIPGVLPPVLQRGHVFIDGALMNNLPVDVMAADGIAHITALDVRAEILLQAGVDESATPPWWRLLWQRREALRPGLVSTLVRAAMVNGEDAGAHRRDRADLLLTPPLEHIGMLDWKNWRSAVDAGYRHAVEVLEARARAGITMRG